MTRLHFEDFARGDTLRYAPMQVSQEEIVAFARVFDPQPFHIDPVAAQESFVGGLIASGWHTCALLMRAIADGFLLDARSLGAPGVEEVRWIAPVRPGATLTAEHEVLETRASRSRPGMGLVRFRFTLCDAAGAPVMEQTNWILLGRRDAPAMPPPPPRPAASGAPPPEPRAASPLPVFDDVAVGKRSELGAHAFGRADILDFAGRFDPQPFHLDEDAAASTHFGGLCASGWHTAAAWMQAMVGHAERATAAAHAAGVTPGRLGPSPGFTNLSWSRPVYPGDTVAFSSTVTAKRRTTRKGWGLVFHRNEGVNQLGETVFGFDGCVFWEARS